MGLVSDVVRGTPGDSERLGYLFDSSRFDLDGLVGEIVIPPEEIGNVTSQRLDRQFAKTPYAVSFRSVQNTGFAFVFVTVHIVWGNDPALRSTEANRLANWTAGCCAPTPLASLFTMATYQHVLPGMSAKAATNFANLIHAVDNKPQDTDTKPQVTTFEKNNLDQKRLPDR